MRSMACSAFSGRTFGGSGVLRAATDREHRGATSSGDDIVNTYVAASTDGTTFGLMCSSRFGNQMEYEMFDAASVPFYGDYNWLSLVAARTGA